MLGFVLGFWVHGLGSWILGFCLGFWVGFWIRVFCLGCRILV